MLSESFEYKKCKECGKAIPLDMELCDKCFDATEYDFDEGINERETATYFKICPNCGCDIEADDSICYACEWEF